MEIENDILMQRSDIPEQGNVWPGNGDTVEETG